MKTCGPGSLNHTPQTMKGYCSSVNKKVITMSGRQR
jgi:hypothetical protein